MKKSNTRGGSRKKSKVSTLSRFLRPNKWFALIYICIFALTGAAILYLTKAATEPYTMYRLSNGTYSYYTINAQEKDNYAPYGWSVKSTRTYTNTSASVPTNVYKLYNTTNRSSWYFTTDYNEYTKLTSSGWTGYGVGFTSATSPTVPTGFCRDAWYKLKASSTTARYVYTDNVSERDSLVASGWTNLGVGFNLDYACTTNSTPTSTTTTVVTPTAVDACDSTSLKKANGQAWVCTFFDEFNGTSLNRNFWVPQVTLGSGFATTNTKDGNARACFLDTPKNIAVSNGLLSLTATKETAPFICKGAGGGDFTTPYTAAQVMTFGKFSQQYGRFEVKAKIPSYVGKGLQETFWLWPNDQFKYGAWPASGEIDLAEFYSQYADYNVPYIHYLYNGSDTATDKNIVTLQSPTYNKNFYNCKINVSQFNTYTAVWQPGYIELAVNGKPCVIDKYASSSGASPIPFDHPFFLALTQAIGIGGNAFDVTKTPLPATTQVDYVRIWK